MTTDDLSTLSTELSHLREQVQALQAQAERRRRRWRRAGALLGALGLVATAASAADGTCTSSPYPFCFTAGEPARATQVNHNFSQVREWMVNKIGLQSERTVTMVGDTAVTAPSSTGRTLWVSGNTTTYDAPIAEVRHSNLSQGVGIGWSSVFATGGTGIANQDLYLLGKGTGQVVANDDLRVAGNLTTKDGDVITRMRALAPVTAAVSLAVNVGVWSATDDKDLAPAAGHVCFLLEDSRSMWATTLDDGTNLGCNVFLDTTTNRWKLRASGSRGHHQETGISVTCRATCLEWTP